jgi:kynureninase
MSGRDGFSLSVGAPGAALHVAAHSHHPWPDVSFAAQQEAWRDAARLLDRKWEHIFEQVIPAAQGHIARQLNLPDPATAAFGPNTHSFVLRILSCLPAGKPIRILTTGSEFMSFSRQIARLEEDGLAIVTRVATEPFESFENRFADAAAKGGHDLVFLSQVFFDSGFVVRDLTRIVGAVPDRSTFVVIDGYHGFMAVPTDFSALASRAFYLAGGYKYAMAGEGACFLHCPPGYGPRPRDTGWYAGFGALQGGAGDMPYSADGSRFLGATFDVSGLYRFNAIQDWLKDRSVAAMLEQVRGIEGAFLDGLSGALTPAMLMVPDENRRGRFLCFRTPDAGAITSRLAAQNIIVDHRGDRLRIGFGIYHTTEDAKRLATALA